MRRFFKRLASYLVIWYANKLFWRGVRNAELRYEKEHQMIYLTAGMGSPRKLVTYNRKEFRTIRMRFVNAENIEDHRLQVLKDGCFYHTADGSGRFGLSRSEIEKRRYGFIDLLLYRAGLLDYSPERF